MFAPSLAMVVTEVHLDVDAEAAAVTSAHPKITINNTPSVLGLTPLKPD